MADDHQHSSFNMGLATIELKRGTAPATPSGDSPNAPPAAAAEVEIEETIFAFAKAPNEHIAKVMKGGSTGARVQLTPPEDGNKGTVIVNLADRKWTFDVAQNLGKDLPMPGNPFSLRIENYWPDFRLDNGKPGSLSDQPNNPAVVVTLSGKGVPVSATPNAAHGNTPGAAPEMPAEGTTPPNHLTLFIAEDGSVTYDLRSRKLGNSSGKLELNAPLTTGWADWQLVARSHACRAPRSGWISSRRRRGRPRATSRRRPHSRAQGTETSEQWVPSGWQMSVPTHPAADSGGLRLEPASAADRARAAGLRSAAQRRQRQSGGIQEHRARDRSEGGRPPGPVLDEQPVQLSRASVEHLDRAASVQDVTGFLEPGEPRTKHRPDSARSGLAAEVDRLAPDCAGIFMLFYVKSFRRPSLGRCLSLLEADGGKAEEEAHFFCNLRILIKSFLFDWSPCCFRLHFWRKKTDHDGQIKPARPLAAIQRSHRNPLEDRRPRHDAPERLRYTESKAWPGSAAGSRSMALRFRVRSGRSFGAHSKGNPQRLCPPRCAYGRNAPWQQVNQMFYDAIRAAASGAVQAKTLLRALSPRRHWKSAKPREESSTRSTAMNPAEVDAMQMDHGETIQPAIRSIRARPRDDLVAACLQRRRSASLYYAAGAFVTRFGRIAPLRSEAAPEDGTGLRREGHAKEHVTQTTAPPRISSSSHRGRCQQRFTSACRGQYSDAGLRSPPAMVRSCDRPDE